MEHKLRTRSYEQTRDASWLLGRRRGRREGGVWEEEEAKHVDLYSLADLEVPFRFHLCVVYGLIQIR